MYPLGSGLFLLNIVFVWVTHTFACIISWMCTVPPCEHIKVYLSVLLLIGIWAASSLGRLWRVLQTFLNISLGGHTYTLLLATKWVVMENGEMCRFLKFISGWVASSLLLQAHSGGFSSCGAQALEHVGLVVVAHCLSFSIACGIFPDQESSLCPLHWQVDS